MFHLFMFHRHLHILFLLKNSISTLKCQDNQLAIDNIIFHAPGHKEQDITYGL